MLQLDSQRIHTGASADDKQQAIRQVAAALAEAGNVMPTYIDGMLAREEQTSTYLGNGIAIPHGTTETRDQVLNTGVQVFQFPQGIDWQDGQMAYLVIGIAAKSDEHLGLLRQLTQVLSDESLALSLRTANADEIRAILLNQKPTSELRFDASLITLEIDSQDLTTLQAINAGKLQNIKAVDTEFVAEILARPPLHLGQGIWLADNGKGNHFGAIAVARPLKPFTDDTGQPVALLVTIAAEDLQCLKIINPLQQIVSSGRSAELLNADSPTLQAYLTGNTPPSDDSISAEFTIRNPHGLHARPGTALVTVIKQFDCDVSVTNLDGSGKPANGRSLMKVVALGVKQGHRLRFTASGPQAAAAIEAIGEAIDSGLGEAL